MLTSIAACRPLAHPGIKIEGMIMGLSVDPANFFHSPIGITCIGDPQNAQDRNEASVESGFKT